MNLLLDDRLAKLPTEYFQVFAVPDNPARPHCLKCKSELFYTFRWGLAHGEGKCAKCGWPTRLYHFVKQPDGTEICVSQLLQYHPSEIKGQHRRKLPRWPNSAASQASVPDGEIEGGKG